MLKTINTVGVSLALLASAFSFNAVAKDTLTVGVDTAFVPFEFTQLRLVKYAAAPHVAFP